MSAVLRKALTRLLVAAGMSMVMALGSGAAHAFALMGTSPGGPLTMNLAMQALVGNQPVSDAMGQWNQIGIGPGQDHAFFIARASGTSGSCGRNQQNEVTWSGTNCGLAFGGSTLAVTTTWSSGGKVIEVDVLFNNTKTWSSYSGPVRFNANGTSLNDLNRVALHELGHAAGLDHPDEAGQTVSAVMNSRISNTDTLQADDIAGAHAIAWQSTSTGGAPICSLTASPASISAGGSSTLVAACSPAATSYTWTNTGFGSTTSAGVVSPSLTTTYSVTGRNATGAGNTASATVSVNSVAVLPDVVVTSLSGPGSGTAGGQINVTASAANNGAGATSSFRMGFYLSGDAVITANDVLIGTCNFPGGLPAGQSSTCAGLVSIPAGIAAGAYNLGAIVDDTSVISESNESNNSRLAASGSIFVSAAVVQVPVCTLTASPAAIAAGGSSTLLASCSPAATSYVWSNTGFGSGAAGVVVSPAVTTTYAVTGINAAGAGNAAVASVSVLATGAAANYADLWWAGNMENGWGMSIHQHGNSLFSVLYVYDNAGKPVWYDLPTGNWDSTFTTYSGLIYQPTSAPLSAYTPTRFVSGASVGSVTITFTSTSTAVMRYTINGISGQKTIQRQIFGYGVSPLAVGDMWWGGTSQDGWGISITQQAGILFGAWFTYGPDGRVSWYVLPNGTWNGTTYSGPFYSTTSSGWLGTAYDANQLVVSEAGSMSLAFTSGGSAVMSYTFTSGPFAGTTQTKQIVRQGF